MRGRLGLLLLLAMRMAIPGLSTDCRAPRPACFYLETDAIFLGRVSFTRHDPAAGWMLRTLVRFDVEERFKGIPPTELQLWVKPDSDTALEKEYRPNQRYLVFATKHQQLQGSAAAMTSKPRLRGQSKTLPPGFDQAIHPPIYYSLGCGITRPASYPRLESDLAMLRAYRAGTPLPRVLGNIQLYPFLGWPVLAGPRLTGAHVTLIGESATLTATTDANGAFSLPAAEPGYYGAWVHLPPYRVAQKGIFRVPQIGCGYVDIQLTTTSTVSGIVLDHRGRPAAEIPVYAHMEAGSEGAIDPYSLHATTDAAGWFSISGLPEDDIRLSAGKGYPDTATPYRQIYHPLARSSKHADVIRLRPGEHRPRMVLWLEPPIEALSVRVQVLQKHGAPARAHVSAWQDGVIREWGRTDARGIASVPCLSGLSYELRAKAFRRLPWRVPLLVSGRQSFVCGSGANKFALTLDRTSPW